MYTINAWLWKIEIRSGYLQSFCLRVYYHSTLLNQMYKNPFDISK